MRHPGQLALERAERFAAEAYAVEADGGQRRVEDPSEIEIVHAGDGKVAGDGEAEVACGQHAAGGEDIVVADDVRRPVRVREEGVGGLSRRLEADDARGGQLRGTCEACLEPRGAPSEGL